MMRARKSGKDSTEKHMEVKSCVINLVSQERWSPIGAPPPPPQLLSPWVEWVDVPNNRGGTSERFLLLRLIIFDAAR